MKFELWKHINRCETSFSTVENINSMLRSGMMLPLFWKKEWEVEARDYDAAMTKLHEYLGWKPYKPMTGYRDPSF